VTSAKRFDKASSRLEGASGAVYSLRIAARPSSMARRTRRRARLQVSDVAEFQLVEKEINRSNSTVVGNDEISTGVSRLFAWAALYPLDPPAIAHFLWFGFGLISESG
jgi:hypothetical protein